MRQTLLLLTVLIASLSFTAFAQDNNSSFSYGGVKAAPGKYIVIAQLKAWGGGDGILTFDYGQIDEKGRRSSGSIRPGSRRSPGAPVPGESISGSTPSPCQGRPRRIPALPSA